MSVGWCDPVGRRRTGRGMFLESRCLSRHVLKNVGIQDLLMVNSTSASWPATALQPPRHNEPRVLGSLGGKSSRRSDIYSSVRLHLRENLCSLEEVAVSVAWLMAACQSHANF